MPYSAVTQPCPLPLQEGRHLLFDAGGAQHPGIAELDQHAAFGVHGEVAGDAQGPQLCGLPVLA
jgi:hypothetical protein